MLIRQALATDLDAVLAVERGAFNSNSEADLVAELIEDPTAQPSLSLLAIVDGQPVGHCLFTRARLEPEVPFLLSILAPVAVIPRAQKRGIGGALIRTGLQTLSEQGAEAVFVLGWPQYYPRHGFVPALPLGFAPTHPIRDQDADAWMVHLLGKERLRAVSGKVLCSDVLSREEYWIEPD